MSALDKAPIIVGGGIFYIAGMGLVCAALGLSYPVELQLIFAAFGMLHGWLALR